MQILITFFWSYSKTSFSVQHSRSFSFIRRAFTKFILCQCVSCYFIKAHIFATPPGYKSFYTVINLALKSHVCFLHLVFEKKKTCPVLPDIRFRCSRILCLTVWETCSNVFFPFDSFIRFVFDFTNRMFLHKFTHFCYYFEPHVRFCCFLCSKTLFCSNLILIFDCLHTCSNIFAYMFECHFRICYFRSNIFFHSMVSASVRKFLVFFNGIDCGTSIPFSESGGM